MSLRVWSAFTETSVEAGSNRTVLGTSLLETTPSTKGNRDSLESVGLASPRLVLGLALSVVVTRVGGEDQNTIPNFINCSCTKEKAMKKSQPSPFTRSKAVQPPDQILERIRQRAYEMYELRGR